ncbi:MAG: Trk system potassium transporter TrkA [Bdellovibrionota bacterium]
MKRIIICGAGEVGKHAAEVLAREGHAVSVIDVATARLALVEESVDVRSIRGSSCHPETLKEASVGSADLLIAATNHDEFNLLSAALGKRMGAGRVVARIHHRTYIDSTLMDYGKEFSIDHLICPEQLTSQAITGKLEDPGVMAIERFAQNKIEMHRYTVERDSKAIGTKLSELRLPTEVRLAVVNRDGHYFTPGGETTLLADDVVTLIGETKHFTLVRHLFSPRKTSNNSVAIMGATSMTEWLSEDLKRRDFAIRVFEKNRARAIDFSERFPHLTVLDSDPTDPTEFKEEHLDEATAFIAVSDDDEHNILGALQAKQLGARLTAAVIHMPTYLPLLENLGVDWPLSPRIVAARELLKLVDDASVRRLANLAPDVADVYEIGPVREGEAVDRLLKDISLPKGSFVAAIQRGGEVHVPGANNNIIRNDILVVIGPTGVEPELRRLFIDK